MNWADSPWGPGALAILAAAESVFFPLPPDPLLIALAVRNPDAALMLAGRHLNESGVREALEFNTRPMP